MDVVGVIGICSLVIVTQAKLCLGCCKAAASDLLLSDSDVNFEVALRPKAGKLSRSCAWDAVLQLLVICCFLVLV